jgi:hypothetical protein
MSDRRHRFATSTSRPSVNCLIAFACSLFAVAVEAQSAQYRSPSGPIHIAIVNPYRMYWVRGSDTLGSPTTEKSVERQVWRATATHLSVVVEQHLLNVSRRFTSDTFSVASDGRVTAINSKPPGLNGRVDLLLRLPRGAFRVGTVWTDTLNSDSDGIGGKHRYDVRRAYEVKRELDTLGHRVFEVIAKGHVDYRDGWWLDSLQGTAGWIDVAGPVSEQFLYDARGGELIARSWSMDLRGFGAIPGARGGIDTLPAGLLSSETQSPIDATLAASVARDLPRGDTSITSVGGPILLHTVRRVADTIESGFARNGGLVGTVRAEFARGRADLYSAKWTDGFATPTTNRVTRKGSTLLVSGVGPDTVVAIPPGLWGIADYSMQELLVPTLMTVPDDGDARAFAIYRPYSRHWDSGTLSVRPIPGGRIATMQMSTDKKPQAMLITSDGDYLYGENSDPIGAERAPLPGTSRSRRLEALLQQMRTGGKPPRGGE